MSLLDFDQLPPEYQRLLSLAKEKYQLTATPLQALSGGRTGAFLFLVSASIGGPQRVEHLVVKFDKVNPKAKPTEVERHRMALDQAPAHFAGQNMANLAYEIEHEGAIALFYSIAGQSLQHFRPLASEERQSRLERLFGATNDYLLKEWNAGAAFEQALPPKKLLERWLGHRLKPEGPIGAFLKDTFFLDPETEGFLIQGEVFPNPFDYGLNPERWQGTRAIDVLTGFQHGDLNTTNILAKFSGDPEALEGFFLIDFALYKAGMPLLYDQCYLEMSYLTRELERASFQKWVSLVTHFSSRDIPNPKEVPIELAGACEVINAGRKSFQRWINETHASLSDDLWGQYWLAAAAAGLNFCNKAALSTEERLAGLIYSAAHLKRFCAQFGIPMPADVRLLYDASKWSESTSLNQSHRKESPVRAGVLPGKALPSGTVTFLLTDIEGSTQLWENVPGAMKGALAAHDSILQEAIKSNHGQVIKTTGDGIHAVFRTAIDGVTAALAAQRALIAQNWDELKPDILRVRMGLHSGEAELRAGDYYGPALNRAARLMSAGYGGQILLSTATAELLRDQLPEGASLRDLGEHRLKDLVRSEHIFQLLHPDLPADFPSLKSLGAFPNNLPVQLTSFIGRQEELKAVKNLLMRPEVRLVTLIGPGGTGKTRLAFRTATDLIDHFKDGVLFVDLAPMREPESVLAAVARTVGLRETRDQPLLDELKEHLKDRTMLLLLDNFEQVTAAGPHVAELLGNCPLLHMLVTSREALHVRGEFIFPVPPLRMPSADIKQPPLEQLTQYEAVRLFIERAQAVKPDFQISNESAPAVAEICFRLDGLPLAIELAAARIRLFPPEALLDRLGSRLKLLRGGARDLPVRQQTLRGAIDWSYELLDAGEQRLFELLSVFAGGCSFEAVEETASGIERLDETGVEAFDGLASLLDKSLIRQVDRKTREPRLLMLETIREYAAERLEADAEFSAAARRAHAYYFADFTRRQWARLKGPERIAALEELAADLENVRTAWNYWVEKKDQEQLNKFMDSLWMLYDARGWYHATIDLTRDMLDVLASAPQTPERIQQEILLQTSLARAMQVIKGYTEEVEQAYTRALELSREVGEIPELFPVLRGLSSLYGFIGQFEKATEMAEKILKLAERLGDPNMQIEGQLRLGYNLAFTGNVRQGLDYLERAIANYDPERFGTPQFHLGNHSGVVGLNVSALILWMVGFPERALERAKAALDLASKLNQPYSLAYARFHTGLLHLWRREAEPARGYAQAVLEVAEEHEFLVWKAVATCLHGAALARLGKAEQGLSLIRQGIESYQDLNTPPVFWSTLVFLQAEAYGLAGKPESGLAVLDKVMEIIDPDSEDILAGDFLRLKGDLLLALSPANALEAESWFQRALNLARKGGLPMPELRSAISLSRLWHAQGHSEQARTVLSEAHAKLTEGFTTPDVQEAKALLAELT